MIEIVIKIGEGSTSAILYSEGKSIGKIFCEPFVDPNRWFGCCYTTVSMIQPGSMDEAIERVARRHLSASLRS